MTQIRIRPAPGRRVPMPGGALLPDTPEGTRVAYTPFVHRRLRDGDVVEVPEAAAAEEKPA